MRTRAYEQKGGRGRPHILNEELFRGALIRERKRSDRSNRPFVLLLVATSDGLGADSSSVWDAAIDALAAAQREPDIAGWFEWRAVIGVIVPDISAPDSPNAYGGVAARFRRALARRLDANIVGRMSLQLHVYPEPRRTGEGEGLWPVDLLLYPELRSLQEQWTTYDAIKRGLDIVGSLMLLLILSPLLLLIAALVKLTSRGPAFFRQVRVGHMMKPFTMLKFRTMYSGADHRPHYDFITSFINANGRAHEPGEKQPFKLINDPRVTPIGRLLRHTSFDELPQLWNVLRGDMSLVGPRPPLAYELAQYESWHRRRVLDAKPGITGLWQVTGRSRTTFDELVRLDLRYARTRSLWTDIKILLATPAAAISGKGAY